VEKSGIKTVVFVVDLPTNFPCVLIIVCLSTGIRQAGVYCWRYRQTGRIAYPLQIPSDAPDGAACPTHTPSSDKQSPARNDRPVRRGDCNDGVCGAGVKAIVNSDDRDDVLVGDPFLLRTLRLWFEIKPPAIDIKDPWAEKPQFDPYTFTLPTQAGPVAPARWGYFRQIAGRKFDGVTCDFTEPVFFRQEVLAKYEGSSGFDVADNGSVSCNGEWGLTRSTWRIGNQAKYRGNSKPCEAGRG
jgi:hypothetical protein